MVDNTNILLISNQLIMSKIVISYRREDSSGWAGRVYDRLADKFGEGEVFIDIDDILVGQDFVDTIESRITSSYAIVAIVGRNWTDAVNADGIRKLDDPDDTLALELRTALQNNVDVLPVLVDGAAMPVPSKIPEDIRKFARIHALELRPKTFHSDVDELINALKTSLKLAQEKRHPKSDEETVADLKKQLADAQAALKKEQTKAFEVQAAVKKDQTKAFEVQAAVKKEQTKAFNAFLAYSHTADDKIAAQLQSALQLFAKPWYRHRALRVFRDTTSLSINPALFSQIQRILVDSEYFILLASPEAARSKWVESELRFWLQEQSVDKILIVLTGGEIVWDDSKLNFDWDRTDALPPILNQVFLAEPLYVDLRWARDQAHFLSLHEPRFSDAVASLAAILHGKSKHDIVGENIRRFRGSKRLFWIMIMGLIILLMGSIVVMMMILQR